MPPKCSKTVVEWFANAEFKA